MGTKLDTEAGRPSIDVEGLLRALGVNQPAEGVDWSPLVRLVGIGLDVRDAVRGVAMPESGYNGATANFAGVFSGFEIRAGKPGCWVQFAMNDTGDGSIERYSSVAQAAAFNPPTDRFDWTDQWQWSINQRPGQQIIETATRARVVAATWTQALNIPWTYNNAVAKSFMMGTLSHHQSGLWVPPGGVLRLYDANNQVPGVNTKCVFVIREPLA